ncbi:bifunctional tetrahydrofolate synthase/dihydrofolate synthase [Paraglaciecola hydrolytica]|uniref:Dihydrofolate synthase/folylpolyglutamate synthase n=1 Tax=Paraglaciecola hydrolytica TaxID=1799789 RepID=A0A136A5Y2_9ALTE|nr:bifunctional tetrahydrofolate synthase/dihydrofolate synthase [Paraglaciecola hydrolytica]KXI30626.1 bifunctional folylpolyglutamate synthase/dihydrofolate synthase [Paraglaciecola hydrolytica]
MSAKSSQKAAVQAAWSLDQWLVYLGEIHPANIELGLERVAQVFQRLRLDLSQRTIITVGGTNGKGTTCAMIEQALLLQGKTVAVFSSPHLLDYRERVRVQGKMLSTTEHCQAFSKIEAARQDISLTYFEFGTLQALQLMADSQCEFLLLEVGLGGRLDAVNIVDADIAVITSIDLDHQEWLGHTREAIATEKAGIFRKGIPVIIGEPEPPSTLLAAAEKLRVKASWQGQEFNYQLCATGFNWSNATYQFIDLIKPLIPAQNASTALQVLSTLGLPLEQSFVHQLFSQTKLAGRRQIIRQNPTIMLDVAHNPHATRLLAKELSGQSYGQIIAVVGMLADKDIQQSLLPLVDVVDCWYCASLQVPRGAQAKQLVSVLSQGKLVLEFDSVKAAYGTACEIAQKDDLILVFGSFYTVAEVSTLLEDN